MSSSLILQHMVTGYESFTYNTPDILRGDKFVMVDFSNKSYPIDMFELRVLQIEGNSVMSVGGDRMISFFYPELVTNYTNVTLLRSALASVMVNEYGGISIPMEHILTSIDDEEIFLHKLEGKTDGEVAKHWIVRQPFFQLIISLVHPSSGDT